MYTFINIKIEKKDEGYIYHSCFCYLGYTSSKISNSQIDLIIHKMNESILR